MSASRILDLAVQQGLLEEKVIVDLRRQIAESKFVVTPEAIAKILVDHGQLTPFQARKLVAAATETDMSPPAPRPAGTPSANAAPPPPASSATLPAPRRNDLLDDLTFADEPADGRGQSPAAASLPDDDIIDLEPVALTPVKSAAPARPATPAKPVPPPAAPVKRPPNPAPLVEAPVQAPARPKAPPPPAEEEVIDLEPALPPAKSPARPATPTKPAPNPAPAAVPKPASAPAPISVEPAPALRPIPESVGQAAPVPEIVDLVPLGPVAPRSAPARPPASPAPAATPARPAVAAAPSASPGGVLLEPAPPLMTDLQPLGALNDPLLTTLDPLAAEPERKDARPKKKKGRENIWDSPLLLLGGGGLGVMLIAFALLLYALTRGSAAEMLAKANQEYQNGSYTNAIAGYDKFLKGYPDDPNASAARVKRGMALLRQVADAGNNPRQALKTAQTVLPEIGVEAQFADARPELSSILPDIADGFAEQAAKAKTTVTKEELVDLANQALELVNNPSYIPASLKKDREVRIAGVVDKLKVAQRSIDEDQDLVAAVAKIGDVAGAGKAAEAYAIRADLLKVYPGLERHPDLVAAIRGVGERERQLVELASPAVAAQTDDDVPPAPRIVLAVREGGVSGAAAGKPLFVQVEGAVYGLDSAGGRILWRRHVGYQTLHYPLSLEADDSADALVADSRTQQLLRLSGASGNVIWRQPIGEPFAQPTAAGERVFVTTQAGRVLDIDAATGEIARTAHLPQRASVGVFAEARPGQPPQRLLQLGEHSTLFVLDGGTLAATETVYLDHKAGSIFVPPVVMQAYVFVAESPADSYTLLHVLAPDAKTKRLVAVNRPFRLKGRITTPLAASVRRVAAVTDLGQVAVYEVDPSNREQPVRSIGGLEASERTPITIHVSAEGNRIWTGGKRATGLEVQPALQQVNRKWTRSQDDAFLGPFLVDKQSLVHVRRRAGWPGVFVESSNADNGEPQWTVQLAVPVVALAVSEARKSVDVLTEGGRLYQLSGEQLKGGILDAPSFPLPRGSGSSILPDATLTADGGALLWAETRPGGRVFAYDIAAGNAPLDLPLPDSSAAPAAAPQRLGQGLLVPLTNGSVALLDAGGEMPSVQPFLPPLTPTALPLFSRPAILGDESSFLISDGRRALYRAARKEQPQPHLALATEVPTEVPVFSPLVVAGPTVYGLTRGEAADSLVAIDPAALPNLNELPLQGRVQSGPFAAGGLVLLAAEPEGLMCIEAGPKVRWQQPLAQGPLAGPPLPLADGDLLVMHQSGIVRRLAADSGEELASIDCGQPLGPAARVLGNQLFLTGSDGVVQRIALPARP